MLRRRVLDALDSPMPLVFVEAVQGAGKRTLLTQWVHERPPQSTEIRMLFEAPQVPTAPLELLRLFWAALQRERTLHLPDLPSSGEQVREVARRNLREVRRPIEVAVIGGDHFTAEAFDAVLNLLDLDARLVIAGFDLSEHRRIARSRGIFFSDVTDRDVNFTLEETRELVREQGADLTETAVTSLFHATRGHAAAILACLALLPAETVAALLSRSRALAALLTELPEDRWPSPFGDFLLTVIHVPRFTARAMALLTGGEVAPAFIERLRDLGFGQLLWHAGMQERVFHWEESARAVMVRKLAPVGSPRQLGAERILEAARATGDRELQVATMVQLGQLDQAEQLVDQQLWDLLPDGMSPVWEPLARLSPLTLVELPALLCVRLRFSPDTRRSRVSTRAAQLQGHAQLDSLGADATWSRLAALARALLCAEYCRDADRLADLASRARGLIVDLNASELTLEAPAAAVGDQLIIAEVLFRTGSITAAAELGALITELIEVDPPRLDPRGERRPFAQRLILHAHRLHGLEDPFDADALLAGLQFLSKDADVIASALSLMWADVDADDLSSAEARLRVATEQVSDPGSWPFLHYMKAWLSLLRQNPSEVEANLAAYETASRGRTGGPLHPVDEAAEAHDHFSRAAGRSVPAPGLLRATDETRTERDFPRLRFNLQLSTALDELRARRPGGVRAALSAAIAVLPRRSLSTFVLARATPSEAQALEVAADELPGSSLLRLHRAVRHAGGAEQTTIDLSAREREVLGLLREGVTNLVMAQELFLSVNTVKFHRANLMRKLGATSRHEVLEAAAQRGL